MKPNYLHQIKRRTGHVMMLMALLGIGFSAFAVTGGGGTKSKDQKETKPKLIFSELRNSLPFTLRNGYQYKGSQSLSMKKKDNIVQFNTIIKYQKGNVIYLIPYKQKLILSKFKTPEPVNR